jgi:hypothetical protein
MNGQRVLAVEFAVLIGVASWAAIKKKYFPWPPTIVKTAVFVSLLGVVSVASDELAAWLGAGFILANLVRTYQGHNPYTGGLPINADGSTTGHALLQFGAPTKTTRPLQPNPPGTNPVNPVTPGPGLPPAKPIIP